MLKRLLTSTLLLMPIMGLAQLTAQTAIHLDAVSMKENRSGNEQGYLSIPPNGNRIVVTNSPMFRIIGFAFNKQRNDLIEGLPEWAEDLRWDIEATIAEESVTTFRQMPFEEQKTVLQQILKERCGLVAHNGKKEAPVYALVLSKSGPKIKEISPARADAKSPGWNLTQSTGKIEGRGIPMDALIYALSKVGLERQIIDRTGLVGQYDISLTWTSDNTLPNAQDGSEKDGVSRASIFTALQDELGLRLEAMKADVDAVIITHITRPSTN
ncbi:TIGR03435 family protein [Terriglobus albidus]|uniref:TIGR03435 family protein n=1 Tax=Terriglobus albidus TaxID=1592106 RepID=UPI0021E0A737|nr:TIGR03435 family protein [Terriglobus albidus]